LDGQEVLTCGQSGTVGVSVVGEYGSEILLARALMFADVFGVFPFVGVILCPDYVPRAAGALGALIVRLGMKVIGGCLSNTEKTTGNSY